MHAGFVVIGAIFWLMILAGLGLLVFWAVRAGSFSRQLTTAGHAPSHETPLDILARRFAAGEIDAEEYKRSRDLLTGGDHKP
jgi:uncharacterized membrane protein